MPNKSCQPVEGETFIMENGYEPIENYGVIGNLNTIALVSLHGSIDFMCYPRFDSPTVFGSMLDHEKGGYFSISAEMKEQTFKQLYLPDSAVLITRFFSEEGIAELTDFMPVYSQNGKFSIIRKITTIRGNIRYKMNCRPRFDYARSTHTAELRSHDIIFIPANDASMNLRLQSDQALTIETNDATASFTLAQNKSACFILTHEDDIDIQPGEVHKRVEEIFHATNQYWKKWISKSNYKGRWLEIVNRSLITLKLLTSQRYGSVVAAGTFALPEVIGGERNWDYRYTWTRDAAFTMYAFLSLGFIDEAWHFIEWIKKQCMHHELQLMYRIDGNTDIDEEILHHLEGYKKSSPVRIGNAAHKQFQLDIYGELIDTIYLYNKYGEKIDYEVWQKVAMQVEFVCEHWQQTDHGIWELRNEPKAFLYSRMMCWVALDRAIRIGFDRSFPYPAERWNKVKDEIFNNIYSDFWNEDKQSFVQHQGTGVLDASLLLMPLIRFISPHEERWLKTLKAIEKELNTDVLIYRYQNQQSIEDGLNGQEGTFSICSFWYVECLAKSGQVEKAEEYFEKMLGYANHLGLYAEQISKKGEQLGNYPQAFTHLSLISAAVQLDKSLTAKK